MNLLKLFENISPQQRSVGQLPADFKPKKISPVLDGPYGKMNATQGYLVGEDSQGVAEAGKYGSRNPDTMGANDYDRYQQDQMDQGKRDFKRQEHEAEWEQEKAYSAKLAAQAAGPWYIRLNGKLIRDKQGNPYTFNSKGAANKAALTMQSKLFNQGKEFMLTTNPNDKSQGVAEASQRVDSLVTDALKIMRGSDVNDAVQALKTVLGNREYNDRRGHYNFYVRQLMDMYGQQSVAEDNLKEFALPGGNDGDSGRWYTDDELADIIGDDWFEDFDVSNDGFNIDTHGEKAKQNLASYANSWFDDKGYNVNVMGVDHNDVDHDLKWYIVGSFQNDNFADKDVDEGLGSKLAGLGVAGAMALGSAGANARVTPDGQGGFTGGLKPSATVTAPADNKPAAEAPKGFSKEYLQKAADPNRFGRYMISVEKAQELLKNMQEGMVEGDRTMSRAAKGHEKYGKQGMQALAKAGREGKDLDKVRDKYNKYDESVDQGVAEGSNSNVYFEVDSENAYNHVMKKFGSVIEWDGDAMVAPRKYWGAIQELAYSAGGEANEVGDEQGVAEDAGDSPVAGAITRRILMQRTDLLSKYGPEKVTAAIDEVADFVGDVDEIGSSDVSGWVRQVEQMLGNMMEGTVSREDQYVKLFRESVALGMTSEDVLSTLKKKLGDYLQDVATAVNRDNNLVGQLPNDIDQIGPAVKTITTDDGREIKIHGNEDDGFRISINSTPMKSKFNNIRHAEIATEMYCAHRKSKSKDYVEEA